MGVPYIIRRFFLLASLCILIILIYQMYVSVVGDYKVLIGEDNLVFERTPHPNDLPPRQDKIRDFLIHPLKQLNGVNLMENFENEPLYDAEEEIALNINDVEKDTLYDIGDQLVKSPGNNFNVSKTIASTAKGSFQDDDMEVIRETAMFNDTVQGQRDEDTKAIKNDETMPDSDQESKVNSLKELTGIAIQEKHHVAFLKVHKCGSSTVQNVFLRFVDSRNLTMIFGHSPGHPLAETPYANMISFKNSLTSTNIVPPPPGRHYDILCCHVIYDEDQFKRYMPHDFVNIGIVREPFKRLESSMRYFNSFPNVSTADFAKDPLRYEHRRGSMCNNRMAYEFNFPSDLFPSQEHPVPDKEKVQLYLKEIARQFDLILINERMEDTLVYMRRLLGWKLEDILFVKQLVAKKETRRFSEEEKVNLKNFLYLDIELYNLSVRLFETKFGEFGQDGLEEVILFKSILNDVGEFCSDNSRVKPLEIPKSKWSEAFQVTREKCKLYSIFETTYVQILRKKIYGTLEN